MSRRSIADKVKAFLARHGVKEEAPVLAAVTELMTENYRYRDQLRKLEDTPYSDGKTQAKMGELERENERLEGELDRVGKLVPVAGSVVLSAEDAKLFNDFKSLGKIEDVKKSIEELPKLQAKIAESDTRDNATKAATALGWNVDATTALINDKKLVVSFVDGKDAAGKDIKVPHVRPVADEKAATKPLADWQKENAAYMAPALGAKNAAAPAPTSTGTQFPIQNSGTTPPSSGDPIADHIKNSQAERTARPSPFATRPAAAAAGT